MADVANTFPNWSTTSTSNGPSNTTTIGSGLDDNLQEIQGVLRRWLGNKGANIASAGTTDLGAVEGLAHTITGTTTITSFGTVSQGIWKVVQFAGVLTLTHNATSLILPGGASITTAAGDVALMQSEGSGNWRCWVYSKASGLPIVSPTVTGPFTDASGITKNGTDATKIWRPRADNITTATTRSAFLIDEDVNVGGSWEIQNAYVEWSVSGNAITAALKTIAGTDPSATNPVYIRFRNGTAATATGVYRAVTGAISATLSSGSTAGTVSGLANRLYFGVADDAGTIRGFLYNPLSASGGTVTAIPLAVTHAPLSEGLLYSSTAEGGAGAADSPLVLYSTVAFTARAIRLLSYADSSQATAGTWASAPTVEHWITSQTPRSGSVVQRRTKRDGAYTSSASVAIPYDNTIPQITEGLSAISDSITPQSAANILRCITVVNWTPGQADDVTHALFDGATDALTACNVNAGVNQGRSTVLETLKVANTTSSTTYSSRIGPSSAATTIYINGNSTSQKLGAQSHSEITLEEIFT